MSWFGASKYAFFEDIIGKATSESIPNGDIDFATALEISDFIRSKQVPPKEAMRIIKRRFMDAENVNMQKSAFKLIDFCIKNGGSHFISEIASKEFMDPLVVMLKRSDINDSLKKYMLENIQTWSIMVSTNKEFDYINKTYTKLQDDGFVFPMINDFVDPNLIESMVAPEWQDSDACMMCSKLFSFITRKHHCRSCGGVFCNAHSSKTIELPELGINIPVRVCDNCYADQKSRRKMNKHSRNNSKNQTLLTKDDDDIQKAIEMSMKTTVTNNQLASSSNYTQLLPTDLEDEDEAMKAAIQASLQDLGMKNEQQLGSAEEPPVEESTGLYSNLFLEPKHNICIQENNNVAYQGYHPEVVEHHVPMQDYLAEPALTSDITSSEENLVIEFVDLVSKLRQAPPNLKSMNPDLIRLQAEMVMLHPKINTALVKEHAELEKFQAMYSKLFTINKLYDDIIQTKLKQEQEAMMMQHTQIGMFTTPPLSFPTHMNTHQTGPQFGNTISPQLTYSQPPQVFQLQQTGLTNNSISKSSLSYAQVPSDLNQPPAQQFTPQISSPAHQSFNSPKLVEHEATSHLQVDTTVAQPAEPVTEVSFSSLAMLDSLQYAPIPELVERQETTKTERDGQSHLKNVTPIKKEAEIVNLIDL